MNSCKEYKNRKWCISATEGVVGCTPMEPKWMPSRIAEDISKEVRYVANKLNIDYKEYIELIIEELRK